MNNSKRNYQIDFLRGVAVLLVLWGHCIQYLSQGQFDFFENIIFRFIYSFHMPLFMAISGYLFYYSYKKYSFKDMLFKILRSILYPIIACNCLFFLIYYRQSIIDFFHGIIGIKSIVKIFYNNLGHLWFLWSYFYSSIGVLIITKLFNKKWCLGFFLFFIFLIIAPYFLEFNKVMNIWMFPYFIVGFLYNKYKDSFSLDLKFTIGLISIPIFSVLFNYFHHDTYAYTSGFTNLIGTYGLSYQNFINIIRYTIGFVGIIMVTFISNCLFKTKYCDNKLIKIVSFLGKYSLQLYIIQTFIIELFVINFLSSTDILVGITSNIYLFNFIYTPIICLIFCIFVLIIIFIINKLHFNKILFGR